MPNNCYFSIEVKAEPENLKKFLSYFIFEDEIGTKKGKYLARTFLDNWKNKKYFIKEFKKDIEKGELCFFGWCAWSCWSCWFEGYPNKKECLTLKEICKICDIKSLNCDSEEDGMCFQESLGYNGEDVSYSCEDYPEYKCKNCGDTQSISKNRDLEDTECYECGENKWELLK